MNKGLYRLCFALLALPFLMASTPRPIQYRQVSAKDGLTYNYVTALAMDKYQRLWVGTRNGLNLISNGNVRPFTQTDQDTGPASFGRIYEIACGEKTAIATENRLLLYDDASDTFTPVVRNGLEILASSILFTADGLLIFDSVQNALFRMDPATREVTYLYAFGKEAISSVRKMFLKPDHPNVVLLASNNGIYEYDIRARRLSRIETIPDRITATASYIDAHNNLWISPYNAGAQCYDIADNYAFRSSYSRSTGALADDAVLSILEIDSKMVVSTDGGGIHIIDLSGAEKPVVLNNPTVLSTTVLIKDRIGSLIAGTTHYGVLRIKEGFLHTLYDENMGSSASPLSNGVILSMWEDPDGGIWLGTDGGGLNRYDEQNETVTQFPSTFGRKVNSICPLDKETLLLKLYNEGLFTFDKRTAALLPFHVKGMPDVDPSESRVNYIKMVDDGSGHLLFFNWGDKNYLYSRKTEEFVSFASPLNASGSIDILSAFRVIGNYTLVASRNTIYEVNNTSLAIRGLYTNENPYLSVSFDEGGKAWFVDANGAGCLDLETRTVERLPWVDELKGCSAIAVDDYANIWIAVNGGTLVIFRRADRSFQFFSEEDGVEEKFYTRMSPILKSGNGNLFIPGASGLMIVSPDKITHPDNGKDYRALLLSALSDNTPVGQDPGGRFRIPNSFGTLSLNFAGFGPDPFVKHRIRYSISGRKDERLVETTAESFQFQHHPAGNYSLELSMLTQNGWTNPAEIVKVHVQLPLWLKWYMLTFYGLIIGSVLYLLAALKKRQAKALEDERLRVQEKKQIEDRILFMTNVAHELRTPLSLIYNPIKKIIEEERQSASVLESLNQVTHQVSKMSQMINLVLDVQKMDLTNSSLFIEPVAFNHWATRICEEFQMECEEKGLALTFDLDPGIGDINLDRQKVEVALSNLLMNAIKYSDSGTITIHTSRTEGNAFVRLAVEDEGQGFTGNSEDLFQRFYQGDSRNIGYGIGLSYTKMLVEKHGGKVGAYRNRELGSTFFFELPVNLEAEDTMTEYRLPGSSALGPSSLGEDPDLDDFRTDNQTLLIVDNQESIIRFIKSEYENLFKHIYTARNGQEALDIIKYKLPSIVVSDVMMPVMNGFELCKAIKSDIAVSHIPVILLTARDSQESMEMGYKLGADCFVPKPFDIRMLYYVIKNQLKNRAEIKRQYATVAFQNSTQDLTFSLADEKFMIKLNKFILDNLSNPDLSIDMVVDHMCISRSTLFYKMNDLTGMSTGKYIKKMRIDKAKDLLEKTDLAIGDISSKLGFAESRYFSTVFKQETGETPLQYKKSARAKDPDAE